MLLHVIIQNFSFLYMLQQCDISKFTKSILFLTLDRLRPEIIWVCAKNIHLSRLCTWIVFIALKRIPFVNKMEKCGVRA